MGIDICIRGGGVVGQVLALELARQRLRVGLVRSAPTAESVDIRSFALNAASRQMLMDLRVWPQQATPVQQMQVFGDTTGAIRFEAPPAAGLADLASVGAGSPPLAWIVDAGALQERLSAAVSFASEIQLLSAPEPAALTVIAQGRPASLQQTMGVGFEQFDYEQCAIAAHIECEKPHQHTAWQWMQGGEICALLPRGLPPGEVPTPVDAENATSGNSVALVWSVSAERAHELQQLSSDEFNQQLQEATHGQLGKLSVRSPRAVWPLMLAQAKQWCGMADFGAWVLAGDAAHAIHPLAGQGLNLGLGDARELAKTLAEKPSFRSLGDLRLLRAYERARKGEAAMLRLATDGLQRLFSAPDARMQGLRNWGMRSFDAVSPVKAWLMRQASGVR